MCLPTIIGCRDINWLAAEFFLKATIVASRSEPVNQYDTSVFYKPQFFENLMAGVCAKWVCSGFRSCDHKNKIAEETRKKTGIFFFFVKHQGKMSFNWLAAEFFLKATIVASRSEPVNNLMSKIC